MENKKFLAIDLGSSSTRIAVAGIDDDYNLVVEGIKETATAGINHGVVVNIADLQNTLKNVVQSLAEEVPDLPSTAIVNVSGVDLEMQHGTGLYSSPDPNNVISSADIQQAVESARNSIQLKYGRYILHSLVEEFVVNNNAGIKNPLNLQGSRIESKVLLMTAPEERKSAYKFAFEKAGLEISDFYFSTLAASSVILTEEQKQSGAIIIDIGNEESNMIAYLQGNIVYAGGIPFGSLNITKDLQCIMQKSKMVADTLKEECGNCYLPKVDKEQMIELPGSGTVENMRIPQTELCQIISARAEEILLMLKQKLSDAPKYGTYAQGIFLIGGGSMLAGMDDLCSSVFRLPVHYGNPMNLKGLPRDFIDTKYANVLGLLKYAADEYKKEILSKKDEPAKAVEEKKSGGLKGFLKKFF